MSNRITLPSTTPMRDRRGITTDELWSGPDGGLILCWEKGRENAKQEPGLAAQALCGELPELCWARGAPNYLAYWQGLRGEDLSVDRDNEFEQECALTKRVFAFGGDRIEREKRQLKLDAARNKLKNKNDGEMNNKLAVKVSHNTMPTSHFSSATDDKITLAAHKLAVYFTEEADLPAGYRSLSDPSRKIRKVKVDSGVEMRFKAKVESWGRLIGTMLTKIDEGQAWRFINLRPQLDGPINKLTENKDFCAFVDYLILRRDKEQCGPVELGGLASLSVAFQREVEKQIQA